MDDQYLHLKQELFSLFNFIQKIRSEIAAIRDPSATDDHFVAMADQLDAIVAATETATNTIMESVETIDELLMHIGARTEDKEVLRMIDTAQAKSIAVFEACAFQDITGQRISKIVKSLQYIEERVNILIDHWGKAELAAAAKSGTPLSAPDADPDAALLHGPQLVGEGVSQRDIDKLFD